VLSVSETAHLLLAEDLVVRHLDVVPDLSGLLFQEAVRQASRSTAELELAERERVRLLESPRGSPIPLVLWAGHLDRATQAAIAAVMLSVSAAEAQVNQWAARFGGWQGGQDRMSLAKKCLDLADRGEAPSSDGDAWLVELRQAVRLRNDLVHAKPLARPIAAEGPQSLANARAISVEARRSCLTVRRTLLRVAQSLQVASPPHLAYCPDVDLSDDRNWGTAEVMTGVRQDVDFPPLGADRVDEAVDAGREQ
jgi:hypothetical protein